MSPRLMMRAICKVVVAAACLVFTVSGDRFALYADDSKAAETQSTASLPDGEDWAVFLGPHGDGVSNEKGIAESWPKKGPPVLWSKDVGTGYSAPSVRGNRVVVHHRLRDEEVVECLRADT